MDRPYIPLNGLRVFEVAIRQGSFTRAAVELRVSQAAVSHQIARLEDRLGSKLFLRTSGGLVPTEEGQALFPVLEHGYDAVSRALDRISGSRGTEILKVGIVTTFAVGWLIPRLSSFQKAHPNIEVRISTNNNRVEILREGLDMEIRFGTGRWDGHDVEPLIDAPLAPLCSPEMSKRIVNVDDLGREILLRSYRANEWERWFSEMGMTCPPKSGPVLDSSLALADLTECGAGIALLPVAMFERRIAEGRLIQPFASSISAGQYYLTWPADRTLTPAMVDFAQWLRVESSGGATQFIDR